MNASQIENELRQMAKRMEQLAGEIAVLSAGSVPEFPAKAQQYVLDSICLRCKDKITDPKDECRGNHKRCYKKTKGEIKKGEYTETDAIRSGLLAPAEKAGRRPSDESIKIMATVQEEARRIEETAAAQRKPKASKRPAQP